ncbi:Multiple organellar RNA editing factor 9, chloroplastic-like protein [Drosera capensis]
MAGAAAAFRLRRSLSLSYALLSHLPTTSRCLASSFYRRRHIHGSPSLVESGTERAEVYWDGLEEEFGCNDWMVTMRFGDENRPREEMVERYLTTLASVVGSHCDLTVIVFHLQGFMSIVGWFRALPGYSPPLFSVEEAKKRMYYYTTASYTAFYAKIDDKTSKKLKGMPGVLSVLPNSLGFQVRNEVEDSAHMVQSKSGSGNLLELEEENGGSREEVKSLSNSDLEQQNKNDLEQDTHSKFLHLLKKDTAYQSKEAIDIINENVIDEVIEKSLFSCITKEVKTKSDREQHNKINWKQETCTESLNVKKDAQNRPKSASKEVIDIVDEDVIDEVNFWKTSVIAYVLGERVTYETMLRFVKVKLKNVTTPEVLHHAKGFYILKFETEEDRKAMLEIPRRFFRSKPLVLQPWEPALDIDKVIIYQYPTWVRFPDLKLQFWGDKVLNKIASKIGVPLRIDEATIAKKILSYARVRIAVDLSKEPVKEVTLKCPNGEMVKQQVTYERLLQKCPKCEVWDLADVHQCRVDQEPPTSRFSKDVNGEIKVD